MRAALGLAGGTRIGFGSCDVFCRYHRTTCTTPCSVPNWVNDVCSRYSTSNGVKGVYCKYHGTTWTTLHQRKHSNSSPMDPNTEIQCEKKGLRERGITSGMFGQVTVWNGYSPMDSFLFLAAWTSGHNWAMKRPVLHNIRQPQNHKWESWWLSFKWTQRCLLQVPWCNLSIRVPLELKKSEAWGVSSKKKSGYQLKMLDHSIWHSKSFR